MITSEELAVHGFVGRSHEELCSAVGRFLGTSPAPKCVKHPLGFYHIGLCTTGNLTLRLHYWPGLNAPPSSAVTPYHDHVWSLDSCVLAGTIENVIIHIVDDPAGSYEVASIKQVDGIDMVVPTSQRVRIDASDATPYRRGDRYSIPVGVFHCSRVAPGDSVITMVRAEVVATGGPRTLVPVGYAGQAPARGYLDEQQARGVLEEIKGLLVPK